MTRDSVAEWLAETKTTQSDLARWSGVDSSTLSKWLSGATKHLADKHRAAVEAVMRARAELRTKKASVVVPVEAVDGKTDPKSLALAHLPAAFAKLAELMDSADSESVQADCAKTIAAYAVGKPRQTDPRKSTPEPKGDDAELLNELKKLEAAAKLTAESVANAKPS